MDWDKLRIFHAAAEAGSFTHASDGLRMSQSAVSRQVSALEKELGISLFHRHARGLVLTEQGELLFRTASDVLNKLQTAETLLADSTTKPAGELRITSTISLGSVWVTQRIREFIEVYPDIRIELILNDEPVDLSSRCKSMPSPRRATSRSLARQRTLKIWTGIASSRSAVIRRRI
jgi:DNA-binding transcriptional LysR family regulator